MKLVHLWKEYNADKKPVAECGAVLTEKEFNVKACLVTCAKCKKSAAFKKAAKHPFYGCEVKKEKKNETSEEDKEFEASLFKEEGWDPSEEDL